MKTYSVLLAVAIFVITGLLSMGYMIVKLGKVPLGDKTYPVYARFSSVAELKPGSVVAIYGLEVGRVATLTVDWKRQMVLVRMEILRGTKLYDDASATLKTLGVIGDKYITIDPGGSGELLKPGGTITETSVPTDVEDLINKFASGDGKKKPDKKTGAKEAAK
jgi:phospholipid/cholesterol/gamma-HCH transport system substrate-binding protein